MGKWLNWKPKHIELKKLINEPLPEPQKQRPKTKPVHEYKAGTFSTIRKAYTSGIRADALLSALNPEKGTYFGLYSEQTYTTKERLIMFGETLGEALDTELSFEFLCEHKKERKGLLLTVATMLPNEWTIRVKGMYLKVVPPKSESREEL